MTEQTEKVIQEVEEILNNEPEIIETRKTVTYDKKTFQFSIKIPKAFALKAKINPNDEFHILVNPPKDTLELLKEEKVSIIIYKMEAKKGERKEGT